MHKRRTIKAALTTATIAVAIALPVSTASAATASPQVHIVQEEAWYPTYEQCTYEGTTLMFEQGSDGYYCEPTYGYDGNYYIDGYYLYSYWDE